MPGAQTREENAADPAWEEARAELGAAEAYNRDLTDLVRALDAMIALDAKVVLRDEHAYNAWWTLKRAHEQFSRWLDETDDPQANGWIDDRGRP